MAEEGQARLSGDGSCRRAVWPIEHHPIARSNFIGLAGWSPKRQRLVVDLHRLGRRWARRVVDPDGLDLARGRVVLKGVEI